MPRICYQSFNFRPATLRVIEQANTIIDDYARMGFDLTLRQLFYQFVSRDLLMNTKRNYKKLGSIINDARMAGQIDWDRISDRTRNVQSLSHWNNPLDIVRSCSNQFRFDKWSDQPYRCEVWVEKDALVGVLEGICNELDVPYFSCRGYTSQSEMWSAGRRLMAHRNGEPKKKVVVFHLGDHDPSGIDMTRDIQARLSTFAEESIQVNRLALNMDQVEHYNPPPNPMKDTDSRSDSYSDRFGDQSWELDALDPNVIVELIREAVLGIRHEDRWNRAVARELEARQQLRLISDNWDSVITNLQE